jgi:hypothetical protein
LLQTRGRCAIFDVGLTGSQRKVAVKVIHVAPERYFPLVFGR